MRSLLLAAHRARRGIGQTAIGLSVFFAVISAVPAQGFFDVPVRINMGGPETLDSYGRTWLGVIYALRWISYPSRENSPLLNVMCHWKSVSRISGHPLRILLS